VLNATFNNFQFYWWRKWEYLEKTTDLPHVIDKQEFSIAMHLIKKKLQGFELPKALPPSLKADPIPMVGSFSSGGMSQPMGMSMVTGMSIL
jgi:hypothetical protein